MSDIYCIYEIKGTEDEEALFQAISPDRQAHVLAASAETVRRERLFSSFLCEALLREAGYTGALHYSYTKRGKPYIDGGPYLSISHSFPFVAAAVAKEPVGIDIECLDEARRKGWKTVARSRFGSVHGEEWAARGDFVSFLSYFTRAEAFAKRSDIPLAELLTNEKWEEEAEAVSITKRAVGSIYTVAGPALRESSPPTLLS